LALLQRSSVPRDAPPFSPAGRPGPGAQPAQQTRASITGSCRPRVPAPRDSESIGHPHVDRLFAVGREAGYVHLIEVDRHRRVEVRVHVVQTPAQGRRHDPLETERPGVHAILRDGIAGQPVVRGDHILPRQLEGSVGEGCFEDGLSVGVARAESRTAAGARRRAQKSFLRAGVYRRRAKTAIAAVASSKPAIPMSQRV